MLLHPFALATAIPPLQCIEVDGSLRIAQNLNILCDSDEYLQYKDSILGGIVIFAIILPMVFWILIACEFKGHPESKLAFFRKHFVEKFYFWEAVLLLERLIVFLIPLTSIPHTQKIVIMVGVILVFLAIDVILNPYRLRSTLGLRSIWSILTVMVLSTELILPWDGGIARDVVVYVVSVAVIIGVLLIFYSPLESFVALLHETRRDQLNSVRKYLDQQFSHFPPSFRHRVLEECRRQDKLVLAEWAQRLDQIQVIAKVEHKELDSDDYLRRSVQKKIAPKKPEKFSYLKGFVKSVKEESELNESVNQDEKRVEEDRRIDEREELETDPTKMTKKELDALSAKGWKPEFSDEYKKYYWWHADTRVVQWERPVV